MHVVLPLAVGKEQQQSSSEHRQQPSKCGHEPHAPAPPWRSASYTETTSSSGRPKAAPRCWDPTGQPRARQHPQMRNARRGLLQLRVSLNTSMWGHPPLRMTTVRYGAGDDKAPCANAASANLLPRAITQWSQSHTHTHWTLSAVTKANPRVEAPPIPLCDERQVCLFAPPSTLARGAARRPTGAPAAPLHAGGALRRPGAFVPSFINLGRSAVVCASDPCS